MKKDKPNPQNPKLPVQAIVTPVSHDPKSGMVIPGEDNVRRAKNFVDENKK